VEPDPKTDKLLVGAASISGGALGPLEVDGLPLVAGGATAIYEIVKAEQLRPAATTVLFEIQARSA
jgi:hypothetical protein